MFESQFITQRGARTFCELVNGITQPRLVASYRRVLDPEGYAVRIDLSDEEWEKIQAEVDKRVAALFDPNALPVEG